MKNVLKNIAAATVAGGLFITASNAHATGTSSAQFLKMGAGARASAMAEAFSSVADDVTATYWNPAGLAQLETMELAAMQNSHFVDTNYQYLAAAKPLTEWTVGVSLYRLDYGSIDGYDNSDVKTTNFDAGSLAGSLSAARKLNDTLMAGLSVKYIQESIENESASSAALDLGLIKKMGRYNVSGVVQNIGASMKFVKESAPLPLTVRAGASTKFLENKLLISVEAAKPNDANVSLSAGAEYLLTTGFLLRGGYKISPGQSPDLGGLVGLNTGLGIMFNRFNLDYSISPFGDLGLSHRFSVGYKFGQPAY